MKLFATLNKTQKILPLTLLHKKSVRTKKTGFPIGVVFCAKFIKLLD